MKNLPNKKRQGGMNIAQLNLMLVSTRKRVLSVRKEVEWLERVRRNWTELYGTREVSQIQAHLRQLSIESDLLKKRDSGIRRQIRRFWKEAYPELQNAKGEDLACHNAPFVLLKATGRAKRGGGSSFNSVAAVEKCFHNRIGGAN